MWGMFFKGMGIALCALVLVGMLHTHPYQPNYSFPYYYQHMQQEGRIPAGTAQCRLPSLQDAGQSVSMVNLTCAETGKPATQNQILVWLAYTDWLQCYQYHSVWACQELTN